MTHEIDALTAGWFSEADIADGYADYVKARYVFGRMEQSQTSIMPWLKASVPDLEQMTVLEVGCGNGPSTVPLAMACRSVRSFDIGAEGIPIARKRCELLGLKNATFFARDTNWIEEYFLDPGTLGEDVDMIFCYALFEHLLPFERLKFLIGAWCHLAIGGHLVILETPNRLYYFDWHSSQIPFADQLPPELVYLWNGFSDRRSIPKDIRANSVEEAEKASVDRLYRFGRGASFHEFYTALGPEAFEVTQTYQLDRRALMGWNADYIAVLERQLAEVVPPPPPCFAQPCLDIVLRKVGRPRLSGQS